MRFNINTEGYYWAPDNELRECIVIDLAGTLAVLDLESLDEVPVLPEDVMIERPE